VCLVNSFEVAFGSKEDCDKAVSKGLKVSSAISSPTEIFLAKTLLFPEANCLIIEERKAFSLESRRGEFQLRT